MQTKEEIKKTVKVVAICVVLFVLILLVYHFFINKWYQPHIKQPEEDDIDYVFTEINEHYQNPSYCTGGYFIVENNDNDTLSTLLLTTDLKVIEKFNTIRENVYCLYDGYYLINNNGNYTLKRKGSIVEGNLSFKEETEIEDINYKDKTDDGAMYIPNRYLYNLVLNKKVYETDEYIYIANNDKGLFVKKDDGKVILENIKTLRPLYIDGSISDYVYIEGDTTYLFNLKTEEKSLEGRNLIFTKTSTDKVENISKNNILYQENNQMGVLDFDENIIIKPDNQEIKLTSNNDKYFAVKKNNKYGLVNSFNNATKEFTYDNIVVMDDYIFMVTNKLLEIYDDNIKKLEKEYNLNSNDIVVTKFDGFYRVTNILDEGIKELIIQNDETSNLVDDLKYIDNSEIFFGKPCYLSYSDNRYSVYIDEERQYYVDSKYTNNVDEVKFINPNLIFLAYHDNDQIFYSTYRVLSGAQVTSFVRDKVEESYSFFKNKKLAFSQENEKISIYYNDILKDELEGVSISPLYDDYYLFKTEEKEQFVKITQE